MDLSVYMSAENYIAHRVITGWVIVVFPARWYVLCVEKEEVIILDISQMWCPPFNFKFSLVRIQSRFGWCVTQKALRFDIIEAACPTLNVWGYCRWCWNFGGVGVFADVFRHWFCHHRDSIAQTWSASSGCPLGLLNTFLSNYLTFLFSYLSTVHFGSNPHLVPSPPPVLRLLPSAPQPGPPETQPFVLN